MKNIPILFKYLRYPLIVWLLSSLFGGIGYAIYTNLKYPGSFSDLYFGIFLYFLNGILSSAVFLAIGSLIYLILRYNHISVYTRKIFFILLVLGYSIIDILKHKKAFEFDKPPFNIMFPLFEGNNLDFWLIYGSIIIVLILVVQEKMIDETNLKKTFGR